MGVRGGSDAMLNARVAAEAGAEVTASGSANADTTPAATKNQFRCIPTRHRSSWAGRRTPARLEIEGGRGTQVLASALAS